MYPPNPKATYIKIKSIIKGLKVRRAGVVDLPSILDLSATVLSRLEKVLMLGWRSGCYIMRVKFVENTMTRNTFIYIRHL